jgi:hypothetical protein
VLRGTSKLKRTAANEAHTADTVSVMDQRTRAMKEDSDRAEGWLSQERKRATNVRAESAAVVSARAAS